MTIDTQLATTLMIGFVSLLSALGLIALTGALWSLGRSGYRKS